MSTSYGIHWFRRDLRVAGNPALDWSRERHGGRVVGLFAFDPVFLSRPDIGIDRFLFLIRTLEALRTELRAGGGDLLVLDHGPDESFRALFAHLPRKPASISFNRDYEPFAVARDARVEHLLREELGVAEVHSSPDHLLIEPHELHKKDDPHGWYQVYTPFSKRWLSEFAGETIQARVRHQARGFSYLKKLAQGKIAGDSLGLTWESLFKQAKDRPARLRDQLDAYLKKISARATLPRLPAAGSVAAFQALELFLDEKIESYTPARDYPALAGTSQLSIYLKNGSITVAQAIARMDEKLGTQKSESARKFLLELVWREFYYHILAHCPRVEHGAFNEKYRDIPWQNRPDLLQAWQTGRTGYPIVDAGMRQLNATGWMHNRVRMVVASFLTKDLLVSWQHGERYFMERLLDGDLAPNNGGWQWAASTGCDPQPYFRIFNPTLQAKRFDVDGEYIRRWVPELAKLSSKEIHNLERADAPKAYPRPIVDHAENSKKAIAMFKAAGRIA